MQLRRRNEGDRGKELVGQTVKAVNGSYQSSAVHAGCSRLAVSRRTEGSRRRSAVATNAWLAAQYFNTGNALT